MIVTDPGARLLRPERQFVPYHGLRRQYLSNFFVGDPEWIGSLERPEFAHSADNKFVNRYAYIAVPAGNTLDINYIHNQAETS